MKTIEKIKVIIHRFCNIMEMVLAFFIIVGLLITFVKYFLNPQMYAGMLYGSFSFTDLLNKTFDLIIGIEFIQMLCKPKSENIIEMLIFLVSRHLILQYDNSLMDFLSILAVCILCLLRRFLRLMETGEITFLRKK